MVSLKIREWQFERGQSREFLKNSPTLQRYWTVLNPYLIINIIIGHLTYDDVIPMDNTGSVKMPDAT